MSIFIKGMEMPTNCWLCPLSVLLEKPREMLFCRITKEEVLRNKVDDNCPLIEVPPHGRLIDADRLLWLINDCTVLSEITKFLFSALVSGEKTVIESEGDR